MLRRSTQVRNFSISRYARAHMKRGSKAADSPLATAFKIGDPEDEDDMPGRRPGTYTPNPEIPNLMSLDKRWNNLDSIEQEEVIIYLDDRARGDWKDLSDEEKKAMWFVNFGAWGPRSPQPDDPGRIYGNFFKAIAVAIVGVSGYQAYVYQQGQEK